MSRVAALVALASAVVVAGLVHGQSATDPTLDKLAAAFAAAYNARDAAKLASMYAEDAVVMPSNQPIQKGRSQIAKSLERDLQQHNVTLKLTPFASAISGDQAYEAGTAVVTLPDGRTESEKYVVIYKRVGGDWKIAYDIWNSDAPPAAAPQK